MTFPYPEENAWDNEANEDLVCRGSLAREGGGLEILRYQNELLTKEQSEIEPLSGDIFSKALEPSKAKIDYERDRTEYIKWIKETTPSMASKYIHKLDKYLKAKKANTPSELRKIVESIPPTKSGNPDRHAYNAIRSYINFLVEKGKIKKSESIDFKAVIPNIKVKARAETEKIIKARDIVNIIKDVTGKTPEIMHARRLFLKLLAFTGLRGKEVLALMNQFNPKIIDETFEAFDLPKEWKKKIAVYDLERVKIPSRKHETKRGYVAVFPIELVDDLITYQKSGYRLTLNSIRKDEMLNNPGKAKDFALFRKFVQNFLNNNVMSKVPNPPADSAHLIEFLQGRAPKSVGGRNYRQNVQNAVRIYYYLVDELKKALPILSA
ncbi:integrase [Thermococcus sp.]